MIIPRGTENTVAVNLIIQHLLLNIKYMFLHENKVENEIFKRSIEEPTFNLTLIDNKHSFLNGKLIVYKEPEKINTLKKILRDLIEHSRPEYSK